jgi:hypothetical protein
MTEQLVLQILFTLTLIVICCAAYFKWINPDSSRASIFTYIGAFSLLSSIVVAALSYFFSS